MQLESSGREIRGLPFVQGNLTPQKISICLGRILDPQLLDVNSWDGIRHTGKLIKSKHLRLVVTHGCFTRDIPVFLTTLSRNISA